MKTIYFDMDGTIFDFYGVKDWLPKIRAYDPSPYAIAKPMVNMRVLARHLNSLRRKGYRVGIISWLSKDTNQNYDEVVRTRKRSSLKRHLNSVTFDEVHLVKYGTPKHLVAQDRNGILFDDNEQVRNAWSGTAYTEKEILHILKELLI